MKKLSEPEVNHNIAIILVAMRKFRNVASKGYTKYDITNEFKSLDAASCVKQFLSLALQDVKYVRKQGSKVNAMWHWQVDEPTVAMAAKVFQKCYEMSATARNRQAEARNFNEKRFVPIQDGLQLESSKKQNFLNKLQVAYNKTTDGSIVDESTLGLNADVVNALCTIAVVERKFNSTMVTWTGDRPDMTLVDLLVSDTSVASFVGLTTQVVKRTKSATSEVITKIHNACIILYREGFKGSMTDLLNNHRIPFYYLHVIKNRTVKENGTYKWVGLPPTVETAEELAQEYKDQKNGVVVTPPVVIPNVPPVVPPTPTVETKHIHSEIEPQPANGKISFIKMLEAEILNDNVIGAEFSTLLQVKSTIASMKKAVAEMERNIQPMQEKLNTLSPKVGYWSILSKEIEEN